MAMVVKNNMSAVKTLNVLNANSAALAKDLRQVATGMKVNSAADDNSGYAISERMRVRIRALEQADQNTQNGANMLKVAEGAVSSTVDILKTMKEKAINAANDSNTDADRATIQKELDQSIDQIDDNALITYNSKTLVDGSRMAKGKATRTTLTNQSLHESTKGDTKLVDLMDRNGNGLNIQTTDTLTISYVIQGRMYTQDIDIDKGTTLKSALEKAAEPYTENSPVGSQIYSVYWSSMDSAEVEYSTAMEAAKVNYEGELVSVEPAYSAATRVFSNAIGTANNKVNWEITANDFYNTGTCVSWCFNEDGTSLPSGNPSSSDTTHNKTGGTISNNYETTKAAYEAAKGPAQTRRTQAEDDALSVFTSSVTEAEATLEESLGDLIPYRRLLGEASYIGKSASGDSVYTANRENAITITAASAGTKYQLSGLTFSVTDSKGQVKKGVNAVLDNFTETIRAVNKSNDNAINLQIDAKANQTIRISLTDMRSEALGLKSSDGVTLSVATQKHANAAMNVLDNAIQKALDQQTDIGAVANRMEQTSNNLHIARDNVQASESTIRDADMAKAMTSYTKNNILLQAAQSMLAQANQSSSNVLSLLQ